MSENTYTHTTPTFPSDDEFNLARMRRAREEAYLNSLVLDRDGVVIGTRRWFDQLPPDERLSARGF